MRENKNIYIITYHKSINYGSNLQCYALNMFLRELGYNSFTINYQNNNQIKAYSLYEPTKNVFALMKNIYHFFQRKSYKRKRFNFDQFAKKYLFETKPILSDDQLTELGKLNSLFIAGSDQIWNTDCVDFDYNYLLDFVENKHNCISYSASTNLKSVEANANLFKEKIKDFAAISVRERDCADRLSNIINRKVCCCVDPVFLIDKNSWFNLAKESNASFPNKYVFCYLIGRNKKMFKMAKEIAKKNNAKILLIKDNISYIFTNSTKMYECGPIDFIKAIKDSLFVITDSFHAVCFSIIFNKNFYVYSNNQSSNRVVNILELADLSDRRVGSLDDNRHISNIIYKSKNSKGLLDLISFSKNYLIRCVKND